MPANTELLREIIRLAESHRLVRLGYRRPGEQMAAEYVVEPYRLHRFPAGPVVHCRQVSPNPAETGGSPWRDFRIDRVTSAADAGQSFEPVIPVTLGRDVASAGGSEAASASTAITRTSNALTSWVQWGDRPIKELDPAEEYYQELEADMLDGQITPDEMRLATELGDRLPPQQRKSIHARIYAAVLHEVVQDGRISHREELYLQQVRTFLDRLGWAP